MKNWIIIKKLSFCGKFTYVFNILFNISKSISSLSKRLNIFLVNFCYNILITVITECYEDWIWYFYLWWKFPFNEKISIFKITSHIFEIAHIFYKFVSTTEFIYYNYNYLFFQKSIQICLLIFIHMSSLSFIFHKFLSWFRQVFFRYQP